MDPFAAVAGEAQQGATKEDQAKTQAAMVQLQQIVESQKTICKLTARCFQPCVENLGSKGLSNSQQLCLWRCAQRYIETQHFVQQYYNDRISEGDNLNNSMNLPGM